MLSYYQNLGAGQTEWVLSIIFMILRKFAMSPSKSGQEFVKHFGSEAIYECFSILQRNMSRNLKGNPDEEEEKLMLSISCIYFLKYCSYNPYLQPYFSYKDVGYCLKSSLKNEEKLLNELTHE